MEGARRSPQLFEKHFGAAGQQMQQPRRRMLDVTKVPR